MAPPLSYHPTSDAIRSRHEDEEHPEPGPLAHTQDVLDRNVAGSQQTQLQLWAGVAVIGAGGTSGGSVVAV